MSEDRSALTEILDHLDHAVLLFDRELIVRAINARAREMLHAPPETLSVGDRFEKIVRIHAEHGGYGGDGPAEARMIRRLSEARSFASYNEVRQLFTGQYVNYVGRPIPSGEYLMSYTDITPRIQAEKLARESQNRFRQLYENTQEGYWDVDADGVTLDVNPAFCRLVGRSRDDIIGRSAVELVDAENRLIVEEQLRLRKQGVSLPYEAALLHSSGLNVHCINTPAPIYGESGELIGSIGLWTDISALKAAQTDLEAARRDAEAANKAKGIFLANMSHEIRTPMNGVIGMAEVLARSKMTPEQSRMVRTIHSSSSTLLRIIDDILDQSKIDAGAMTLEDTTTPLRDLTEDVVQAQRVLAVQRNVRLLINFDPAAPHFLRADPMRLRQIMTNLLNNAIKFSARPAPDSPGVVRLSVESVGVDKIAISVTDNGIGISAEALRRLFQPFSQAEDSTTRRFGGAGLGLVITRGLVELMGGSIDAESTPDVGSTFTVTLPAIEAPGDTGDPDISGVEILALIDAPLQSAGVSYLGAKGVNVRIATDEKELVSWLERGPADPIVGLSLAETSANRRAMAAARAARPGARFFIAAPDPFEWDGLVAEDCFVAQRYPMAPSQLVRGVAALAGRAERDPLDFGDPLPIAEGGASSTSSARILLVEDNPTNQEVIAAQLHLLGHAVEIADNGAEGFALWRAGEFDLVLADCHMPKMDGYALTKAIREAEQATGGHRTPIIAITANATESEDERRVASGMDAYLVKPVELVRLRETLDQQLEFATPSLPSGDVRSKAPLVDWNALTEIIGEDTELKLRFLRRFVEPADQIVNEIDAASPGSAEDAIGLLGHKLKSSARTIGAHPLADACERLEAAGAAGDWATIELTRKHLAEVYSATRTAIEQYETDA